MFEYIVNGLNTYIFTPAAVGTGGDSPATVGTVSTVYGLSRAAK